MFTALFDSGRSYACAVIHKATLQQDLCHLRFGDYRINQAESNPEPDLPGSR